MFTAFSSLPTSGLVVIALALAVFVIALVILVTLYARYKRLQKCVSDPEGDAAQNCRYLTQARAAFEEVYQQNGANTNTPAIIETISANTLRGSLLGERYLNNAVSLLVTLGLFGTFLGLTLSVGSLTELISLSPEGEWLGVLDSVGGGLLSALSGMGVAFSTSLVGVACAILVTILRTVLNPAAQREKLQTMTELWLDHAVASTIIPENTDDDALLVAQLKQELSQHAAAVQDALNQSAMAFTQALASASDALAGTIEGTRQPLERFSGTVDRFNGNVRDFTEFNQNLRNNIERMDVNFIRLTERLSETTRRMEGGDRT